MMGKNTKIYIWNPSLNSPHKINEERERLRPQSRKLINTATYVVETQKVLHTSGKS